MSRVMLVANKKQDVASWQKEVNRASPSLILVASKDVAEQLPLQSPSCVLLYVQKDFGLPLEMLQTIQNFDDHLPVIILSDSNDLQDAVALMKAGTVDFFTFPLEGEKLKLAIANAIRMYDLTKKVFLLESQMEQPAKLDDMVGRSE